MTSHEQKSKLEFLGERYEFAAWRDPGQPAETLFVLNFLIGAGDLPGFRRERIDENEADEGWPRSVRSLWRSEADQEVLIDLLVFEGDSRDAARYVLLHALGQFEAVLQRDEEPGDLAFTTPGRGAIVYALANLVPVVRAAGGSHESVTVVAKQLEEHLRARPDTGGRVVPKIDRLATGPRLPDGAVRISLDARDPLGRPLWFKIFGSGGEVLMHQGELAFRPYAPGRPELTVLAINENGGVARESISLGDTA
jgi:hypothetical protein